MIDETYYCVSFEVERHKLMWGVFMNVSPNMEWRPRVGKPLYMAATKEECLQHVEKCYAYVKKIIQEVPREQKKFQTRENPYPYQKNGKHRNRNMDEGG